MDWRGRLLSSPTLLSDYLPMGGMMHLSEKVIGTLRRMCIHFDEKWSSPLISLIKKSEAHGSAQRPPAQDSMVWAWAQF